MSLWSALVTSSIQRGRFLGKPSTTISGCGVLAHGTSPFWIRPTIAFLGRFDFRFFCVRR